MDYFSFATCFCHVWCYYISTYFDKLRSKRNGINHTSRTLVSSGIETLIYILYTRGKSPVYLGSSFAFIAPLVVAFLKRGVAISIVSGDLSITISGMSKKGNTKC